MRNEHQDAREQPILPLRTAFDICLRGLRTRLGRSLITLTGVVLGIAFAGLGYALMLVKQVREADTGTEKMQKIAAAVREGANAYLAQQFKKIVLLIVILTGVLYFLSLIHI